MARTMTCTCGEVLTGKDDDELFELGKQHMAKRHPEMRLSDDETRAVIRASARDT